MIDHNPDAVEPPMTPTEAQALVARLRDAHAATTKGRAVQFHPSYCPEAIGHPFSTWDSSHELSMIRETGSPYRLAEFRHAADANFMQEALNAAPSLLDAIDALAAEVTRLREAGQEAAMQVIAADGQAQEALERAVKAEERVAELEGELLRETFDIVTGEPLFDEAHVDITAGQIRNLIYSDTRAILEGSK